MNNPVFKRQFNFVLAIPIINSIATLTVNYFNPGTLNPGTIRAAIIGLFILIFTFRNLQQKKTNRVIIIYLIYLFFLVILSSSIAFSFYNYIKIVLALMMFPIGVYYFRELEDIIRLNKLIVISLSFYVINLIISNFFQLGTSDYLEDSVYFGSGRVNIAKSVALMILTTPILFLYFKPKKKFYYYLSILTVFGAIILVLLSVKRSALLSVIMGFSLYILLSPQKLKKLQYLIVIGIIGLLTSNLFIGQISARFQAREERFEFTDPEFQDEENRVREFYMVVEDMKSRNLAKKLFGTEIFNDREYYHEGRMLHTDYMMLLHGTGIVGFLWFYMIYFLIFSEIRKYAKKLRYIWAKELQAITIVMLAASLILSIAGSIYTVDILSMLFLYTGAVTGVLKNQYFRHKQLALLKAQEGV